MAAQADRGVPLSTLSPKYLHSNSTSHTWPFSAIAELIDNAYDPDVNAKQFWIDKTVVNGKDCLIFMDNGNGLDLDTMQKMLSFGYSDKVAAHGFKPIGIYGNGFKSGSMRLGSDVIVFSKSRKALCVGMLSQTYLKEIEADQIMVPIICFEQIANQYCVKEEHKPSLQDILRYSPFRSEAELLTEVKMITSTWSTETTGTRIIIWNLRECECPISSSKTPRKVSEFDFETDRYDIRIPSDVYEAAAQTSQQVAQRAKNTSVPESMYSLRAYCSILYLKPRMQIMIRGHKVKSQLISKSLAHIMRDGYKPAFLDKRVTITFGYNTKSKDQYGIMMYHKNRLIKAYERVGCQLRANNQGVGVIGVIPCDFLEPTHNKQSFMENDRYRKTLSSLALKLEDYCKEIRFKKKTEDPNSTVPIEDTMKRPDQNWVQCDLCLKWRKLPDGIDCSKLPDKWSCQMNPDPQFRNCKVEEEREDSDDEQTSYCKTYRIQERKDKKKEEEQRIQEIAMKKWKNQERLEMLARKTQDLCQTSPSQLSPQQKRQLAVNQQLEDQRGRQSQTTVRSPSISTTPKSRMNSASAQGGAAGARSTPQISSVVSQNASSPSSNGGLPIIASVCSLSEAVTGKRTNPDTPQRTPKRPRVKGLRQGTPDASPIPDVSPPRPQPLDVDSDDTDDDLLILETASTPKPKKSGADLTKVKTEDGQSDADVSMLLECNDDAAVDAGWGPPPPADTTSITTQTEAPKIKEENGNESGEERVPLQNGDAALHQHDDTGEADAPDPCQSSKEAQEQQDWLLDLMQATAQERDSLQQQLHQLTCQLQDAQKLLRVKKECSHQAVQTEEAAAEEKDYKSLFERARQRVDELVKDKQALLAARDTSRAAAAAQGEDKDVDAIAAQVEGLVRELEQRDKEREEMRSQLDRLTTQCEELQQQLRDKAQEGTSESTSGTASGTSRSLIELRQNIGQLLVSFVPALDLSQVNFECNVIDEMLEQVICDPEMVAAMGQRVETIHSGTQESTPYLIGPH